MVSIITSQSDRCYICHRFDHMETHHLIFGRGKRKKADEDGLTVPLCHYCHRQVHGNYKWYPQQLKLKQIAQEKWESKYGDRDDFIKRYGRSYL